MQIPPLKPLSILIEGWTNIPHSYAIVTVFQIHALQKIAKSTGLEISIYVRELPYPAIKWYACPPAMPLYPASVRASLARVIPWSAQFVDIVYRIAYPYYTHIRNQPLLLFYTAECKKLPQNSLFRLTDNGPQTSGEDALRQPHLFLTTPSAWSACALDGIVDPLRNRVIGHGVDLDVFRRLDDDVVFPTVPPKSGQRTIYLHAGAMTQSKGLVAVLMFFAQQITQGRDDYLVLKCTTALYESRGFVAQQLQQLNPEIVAQLVPRIVYIDDTLSFENMNQLYNACDVYLAPFFGEGFNLIPLECLAAGMALIITEGGGSDAYVSEMRNAGGIYVLDAKDSENAMGTCRTFHYTALVDAARETDRIKREAFGDACYTERRRILTEHWSWDVIAKELVAYMDTIVANVDDKL